MALGAFWASIMSLLVKLAGRRIPSQELVLVRALITLALSYAALRRAGLGVRGTHPRLLVLRGVAGCAGLTCFYYSLVHLPLGEATLIQYTNPVFAAVMAAVVLRERVGAREVACLGGEPARRGARRAAGGAARRRGVRAAGGRGGDRAARRAVQRGRVRDVRRMGAAEDSRRVVLYLRS
jgi:uncharacterized membrane protein